MLVSLHQEGRSMQSKAEANIVLRAVNDPQFKIYTNPGGLEIIGEGKRPETIECVGRSICLFEFGVAFIVYNRNPDGTPDKPFIVTVLCSGNGQLINPTFSFSIHLLLQSLPGVEDVLRHPPNLYRITHS